MGKYLPVTECGCRECTCSDKIPTVQIDVSKLGPVPDAALAHAAAVVEHAAELYDLTKAHVAILRRMARPLTTAEGAYLTLAEKLLRQIGGAR